MTSTATQLETPPGIELTEHQTQSPPSIAKAPEPTQPIQREPTSSFTKLFQGRKKSYVKLFSCGFAFFVAGINDGSIGALIPYIIREHNITTAVVSSIYGANFAGWLLSALFNTHLTQYLALGAMVCLGATIQILSHVLRSWNPPLPLLIASFVLASLGQAFQDTHGNTFAAGIESEDDFCVQTAGGPGSDGNDVMAQEVERIPGRATHRALAFIHASYMAGCFVGPFVATAIASTGPQKESRWYLFYTFPLAIGVFNLVLALVAFRDRLLVTKRISSSEPITRETLPSRAATDTPTAAIHPHEEPLSANKTAFQLIAQTLTTPSVGLLSLFYFFYIGAILTVSGWVVEYLVDVRHGDLSTMGYVPAGFSGGGLLGRTLLAEPTIRWGERRMVVVYCVIAVVLQLVFWLVPNIIAASIAVSFLGFVTGPLFAAGMSIGSKLFPRAVHSTALGFVFVCAQLGGALFPIITGIVASHTSVAVLQPITVALLVATGVSWLLVPRPKEGGNEELHQE